LGFGAFRLRKGFLEFLHRAVLRGDVFYDVHEVVCTAAKAAIEVLVLGYLIVDGRLFRILHNRVYIDLLLKNYN
jgi:hypothetical protein